jgi:hypothetical protein
LTDISPQGKGKAPTEISVDRKELFRMRCPGCGEVVGTYMPGEKIRLSAGGLLIEVMNKAECKYCGYPMPFRSSDNLARILKKAGASDEQIKEIFLEVNDE